MTVGSRTGRQWQDRGSASVYEQTVAVPDETPAQAAYRRMLEHSSACRTCLAPKDGGGVNTCETAGRLYEEYRQTRRGPNAPR